MMMLSRYLGREFSYVSIYICYFFFLLSPLFLFFFFFFNDTATTEIYTLSLHDALPISTRRSRGASTSIRISLRTRLPGRGSSSRTATWGRSIVISRSEEHTSELQSHLNLVCRLLLEKKKKKNKYDDA